MKFSQLINEDKKHGMSVVEKTILFTDVKDSSKHWAKDEERMFNVLQEHEKQIEKLSKQYKGEIIKSIGDAFMLSFNKIKDAIDFAIDLQKDLKNNPIKVGNKNLQLRIGICGGKMFKKSSKRQDKSMVDYFGNIVNLASRLESIVCDVGDVAFGYIGKVEDLKLDDYTVDVIDFKENCKIDSRKRSQRLLTDVHNYMCKNISQLKGVPSITAYKVKL